MRSRATLSIAVAILAGLAAIAAVGAYSYHSSHAKRRFDRPTWIRHTEWCADSPRGRMVDDLVARHLNRGMSMQRVRQLLGRPDETGDGYWLYNVDREEEFLLDTCVTLELQTRGRRLERAIVGRDS